MYYKQKVTQTWVCPSTCRWVGVSRLAAVIRTVWQPAPQQTTNHIFILFLETCFTHLDNQLTQSGHYDNNRTLPCTLLYLNWTNYLWTWRTGAHSRPHSPSSSSSSSSLLLFSWRRLSRGKHFTLWMREYDEYEWSYFRVKRTRLCPKGAL